MNRVRVVAIIAASVGGAIAAGSFFGDQQQSAQIAPQAPAQVSEPSLVGLAEPAAPREPSAPSEPAAPREPAAPGVVQASILPAPSQSLPPRSTPAPDATPSLISRDMMAPAPADGSRDFIGPRDSAEQLVALDPMAQIPVGPERPFVSDTDLAQLDTQAPASDIDPEILSDIGNCAVFLVATPAPEAILEVSVFAPCDGGALVRFTHGGMSFEERLSAEGLLMASVPALSDPAEVSAIFADARVETDITAVPDFAAVSRLVLQWSGMADLSLVAWERGSDQPLTAQTPRASAGMVHALGTPGAAQVQVYTWPLGETAASEAIALEVEAAITAQSCAQDVSAQTLLVSAAEPVRQQVMEFTMPACDGVGGYLLLHNPLPQMTLAQN